MKNSNINYTANSEVKRERRRKVQNHEQSERRGRKK
jgi:hypothetical protein